MWFPFCYLGILVVRQKFIWRSAHQCSNKKNALKFSWEWRCLSAQCRCGLRPQINFPPRRTHRGSASENALLHIIWNHYHNHIWQNIKLYKIIIATPRLTHQGARQKMHRSSPHYHNHMWKYFTSYKITNTSLHIKSLKLHINVYSPKNGNLKWSLLG